MCVQSVSGGTPAVVDPKPKSKNTAAKGAAKAKTRPAMKAGICELAKLRVSDLREAFPRFNRSETKKSVEKEVLAKVGSQALAGKYCKLTRMHVTTSREIHF